MPSLVLTLALVLAAAADAGAPAPFAPAVPTQAPPPADRYELHRATDGTGDLEYEGPGFRARIARDGTARFSDKRFTMRPWSFLPFAPLPNPRNTPTLQSTLSDLLAHRSPRRAPRPDPDPRPGPTPLLPQMSPYRPDPKEACQYPRSCYFEAAVVVIGAAWNYDLTDELMRLGGKDPYRVEKAHFLAATADLRGGLAARALAENMRRAAAELPAKLEGIACDPRLSLRERRATLEALRQEMDAGTPAGRDASAAIAHFLETRFEGDRVRGCSAAP